MSTDAEFCSLNGVGLSLADVERVPEEVVDAVSLSTKGTREWGLVRLHLAAAIKETT